MKRYFILFWVMIIVCFFGTTFAAEPSVKTVTGDYLKYQADFYIPTLKTGEKAPVVFLAHNGGTTKDAWGDFPKQLAENGWLVVNFTWNGSLKTNLEVETAAQYCFKEYANIANPEQTAFIGGCRGGANMVSELTRLNKLPCKIKTMVLLSVSEGNTYTDMMNGLKTSHAPILAFYTLKDRLGAKYQTVSKQFADELLTQPKTVISLDAAPHGHELVTDPATKDQVRREIIQWLQKYLVK